MVFGTVRLAFNREVSELEVATYLVRFLFVRVCANLSIVEGRSSSVKCGLEGSDTRKVKLLGGVPPLLTPLATGSEAV